MRLGLQNQEIFELPGTYQHSSWSEYRASKCRHLAKIRLGKLGFERCLPRHAHRVPLEVFDDVAHIFSGIASADGRYGDR